MGLPSFTLALWQKENEWLFVIECLKKSIDFFLIGLKTWKLDSFHIFPIQLFKTLNEIIM
jgi:hypothetical protein